MKNTSKHSKNSASNISQEHSVGSNAPTAPDSPQDGGKSMTSSAPSESLSVDGLLDRFASIWLSLQKNFEVAAGMICKIIDLCDGDHYERIAAKVPSISRRTIDRLEAVGRGRVIAQLAIDPSVGAACLAKLAVETQRQYADRPLAVIVKNKDGEGWTTEFKNYRELSIPEAGRVFGPGIIRTPEQQQEVMKHVGLQIVPSYEIDHETGLVRFHKSVFSMAQLEALLENMKAEQIKRLAASGNLVMNPSLRARA